jgi:hypothetical protein
MEADFLAPMIQHCVISGRGYGKRNDCGESWESILDQVEMHDVDYVTTIITTPLAKRRLTAEGRDQGCRFSCSINKDRRFTPRYYEEENSRSKVFSGVRQLYFVNERTIGSYMISSKKCVPEHHFGWWELSVRVKIEGEYQLGLHPLGKWSVPPPPQKCVWTHSTCCTVRFCITHQSNWKNRTSHKVARAFQFWLAWL